MDDKNPREGGVPPGHPKKDWSYSATRKIVQQILGPNTRLFYKKGAPVGEKDVVICYYRDGKATPIGAGVSFYDAIINTFVVPLKQLEDAREAARLKEANNRTTTQAPDAQAHTESRTEETTASAQEPPPSTP